MLNSEIRKIVEFQNTKWVCAGQKTDVEIEHIIEKAISDYKSKNIDFTKFENLKLKQNGREREVKQYSEWSSELFFCIYLKRCLDKEFRVQYPNRNEHIHLLFGAISSIRDMKDYVIVKFDFEDFFNSISSGYMYEKYISNSRLQRFQKDIFKDFVSKCPYCYAGINTSNVMAEIVCEQFDNLIRNYFYDRGLVFYKRYVDDGILIFNRYISDAESLEIIKKAIQNSFYDDSINNSNQCNTRLNTSNGKYKYISKRTVDTDPNIIHRFNYLGYQFDLNANVNGRGVILNTAITYGITDVKIQKYTRRIEKIVDEYSIDNDMELFRHRIRAFCCRTVYRRKKDSTMLWKVKGFISNYNELRYHMAQLDPVTEDFLKNGIVKIFDVKGIAKPYFLKDTSNKSPYSIYNTLSINRTLLFEENERIGIGLETLKNMCCQVGITIQPDKTYYSLLREYLITIRVGH